MARDDSRGTQAEAGFSRDLAEVLVAIKRATKVFLAYPANHPARAQALDRSHKQLTQILAGRAPLAVQVSYHGFSHGDTAVGPDHPLLHGFSLEFTLRGIQAIRFLSGVRPEDLQHVTQLLITDAEELARQGGSRAFLRGRGASGVEVDDLEVKFAATTPRAETVTGEESAPPGVAPEAPPQAPSEPPRMEAAETRETSGTTAVDAEPGEQAAQEEAPPDLETLILELQQTDRPARYEHLTEELAIRAREAVGRGETSIYLRILTVLARELQPTNAKPETVTRYARWTVRAMLDETGPRPVIEGYCRGEGIPPEDVAQLLLLFQEEMAQPVLDQLLIEREMASRQKLADLLVQMGPVSLPVVKSALKAPSWETARRLFPMLPRLPAAEAIDMLKRLARHYDARIRRECIRALGHMGAELTGEALLTALQDTETSVRQAAMAALGGLKVKAAVPPLRQIAQEPMGTRALEEHKMAVAALGAIGDPEAVPTLVGLLQRKRWLLRRRTEELQVAAAYALGALGRPEAMEALRAAAQSASGAVRQACEAVLRGPHRSGETEETR